MSLLCQLLAQELQSFACMRKHYNIAFLQLCLLKKLLNNVYLNVALNTNHYTNVSYSTTLCLTEYYAVLP